MALDSVLITGCSAGGIGSALALAFQTRRLHVFATARSLSKMQHLSGIPNVTLVQLDVTDPASVATAVKSVKETGNGKLKYLINNAGGGYVMPVLDTDIEKGKEMFEVNFWGPIRVANALSPMIIESTGTIVNISSGAAYINFPWTGKSPLSGRWKTFRRLKR